MAAVEITQTTARRRAGRPRAAARAGGVQRRQVRRRARARTAARRGIVRRVWGQIRGHPFVTAGVALGAGMATGFLAHHAFEEQLHPEPRFLGMSDGAGRMIGSLGAAALLGGVGPIVARRFWRMMIPSRTR